MSNDGLQFRSPWERGVVILSIDTEQRWGYVDLFDDAQFDRRYPDALGIHDRMLAALSAARVSATWFVVGGMSLHGSHGPRDRRMSGLPSAWVERIPAGSESGQPLWYRRSFVERLRDADPPQEIGLHGGLTHLLWTGPAATRNTVECELSEGVKALEQIGIRPLSFSFGREQEAHHDLLPAHGVQGYRGRTVSLAHRLGRSIRGKLLRAADEWAKAVPPVVWPQETLPGLWNIPASLFLYPLGAARSRLISPRSRVERFSRGLEAAARHRAIFHYCLHPENLAESPSGCSLFEEMLDRLRSVASLGDIEVLTMGEVVARMDRRETTASLAGFSIAATSKERKTHE